MNLNNEKKDIVEQRLGVRVTLTRPVDVFRGKYRLDITDNIHFVSHTALTPNRAFEKTLNLWIQYDHHTPYVDLEYLVTMIKNLPIEPEATHILSRIVTEEGEMNGLFTLVDGYYKLYCFHKAIKRSKT
ncbi:MAG TPA: hypothetical protein VJ991_04175 [Balneolales bacterium]|nr:hypothetical protein [Balneolales bacterium]